MGVSPTGGWAPRVRPAVWRAARPWKPRAHFPSDFCPLASSDYCCSFSVSSSIKKRRGCCRRVGAICPFKSSVEDIMVVLAGGSIIGREIQVAQGKLGCVTIAARLPEAGTGAFGQQNHRSDEQRRG